METRKTLDGKASGLMVMLCLIWGGQQVFIKSVAADIAPVMQMGLRSGLAAVLVAVFIRIRGGRILRRDGSWRPGLLAGLLLAAEFIFLGEGLLFSTASHMIVFLYTAPVFAALGLHWKLPEERLKPAQWAGIALTFTGIAIAFFTPNATGNSAAAPDMFWGDFLGLIAGISWGASTVVVRCSRLTRTPAANTTLYQLIGVFLILMLAAVILGETEARFNAAVYVSLAFQTLAGSFMSLLVWFWLMRFYLASRLGVLAFLTPLFGVAFGVYFLDEPLELSFICGAALVFIGIVLVNGYEVIQYRLARRPAGTPRD